MAKAAGYEVVGSLQQTGRPRSKYHIGSGKAKELAEMVAELGAEKVIFGNELKVVQMYNLAKITGVEVIDRLQLILEIFRRRATTEEANLQIELARLRYELAHAREKVRLARISEQPGFMGLGKYEVDVYHEAVRRQVHSIEEKLSAVKKTRKLHRVRRRNLGFPLVSLAGYTNSGKSTLFNALTEENVPVDSRLFTTLSTTTRAVKIHGEKIMLTDTVGFIDRLPLTLVEAFHSTLEETIFSDLILLVIDVSEPMEEIERKILCCLDTIRDIGATGIPILTVLNKIDLLTKDSLEQRMENVKSYLPNLIPVSALYKINLNLLKQKMFSHLVQHVKSFFTVPINPESLSLLSWVFDHAKVRGVEYKKDRLNVLFKAMPQIADRIRYDVEKLGGVFKLEELEGVRAST